MTTQTKSPVIFLSGLLLGFLVNPSLQAQEETNYRYLTSNVSFSDVDIGKVLNRLDQIGVRIPFSLEGDASVRLQIQVPINALREAEAYRFDGTISSRRLKVVNLTLVNTQIETNYRDGVLNLSQLSFQIPDAQAAEVPPGTFHGTGRMELVPQGELSLDLQLDKVPARTIGGMISQPAPVAGGTVSGKVLANVPADRVRDVAAWNIDGNFSANGIQAKERVLDTATFQFLAREGELQVKDLTAKMEGAKLSGTATAKLTGDLSYGSDLKLTISEPGQFLPAADVIQPAEPLQATARLSGRLSPLTFQASGNAKLPQTKIGRLQLESGELDYSVTDEQLALSHLTLQLYSGAITGQAALPRQGERPASLNFQIEPALNLDQLGDDLSGFDLPLVGELTGTVKAFLPREQLADLAQWDASANLSIQQGTAWGLAIQEAGMNVLLKNGVASLSETGLTWANSRMDLAGEFHLAEPQNFQAELKLFAGDLQDLNQLSGELTLPAKVGGSLELAGDLKGQIKDFQWLATGNLQTKQLTFDQWVVDSITAQVSADPRQAVLNNFSMKLYEGKATGSGQYPLQPERTGQFQFDWKQINLGNLLQVYVNPQMPVVGLFSGTAQADLSAVEMNGGRRWTAKASFEIPQITVSSVEAGNLKGTVDFKDQNLKYQVTGTAFEGEFFLEGDLPTDRPNSPANQPEEPPPAEARTFPLLGSQGQVRLTNVQLQNVWRSLSPKTAGPVTGQLSLTFQWSTGNEGTLEGAGTFTLKKINWGDQPVIEDLQSEVTLRDHQFLIPNTKARIAGAEWEASAVWDVHNARSRRIKLHALNVNLPAIAKLAQIPEDLIEGRGELNATILPREIWHWDVRLASAKLKLGQVELESVSLPIRGTILPTFERGQITIRSAGSSFAGGRIQGNLSLSWADRRQIKGQLTFINVTTSGLAQQGFGSAWPGEGKLKGTLQVEGTNLGSWLDASLQLDAQLSRNQPRRLPIIGVLQALAKTLSFSEPVDEGWIKAVYSQNTLRINTLTVRGPALELKMQGTISANKRLKLVAFVKSGRRSIDRQVAHFVGGQLGDRVVGILADRLVEAKVSGTIDRPIVSVKPLSLVDIKAIR